MFKQTSSTIEELVEMFGAFDYLLVEGLKTLPLPRIAIFRNKLEDRYFEVTDVIASDDSIKESDFPQGMNKLDLNNPEEIIDWININAKRVK